MEGEKYLQDTLNWVKRETFQNMINRHPEEEYKILAKKFYFDKHMVNMEAYYTDPVYHAFTDCQFEVYLNGFMAACRNIGHILTF